MTTSTIQSEPFPDLAAAEASSRSASPDASARVVLLRALLAGVVALLVMLLPTQPAASRGEIVAAGSTGSLDAAPRRGSGASAHSK
jgi:hypothetical protein